MRLNIGKLSRRFVAATALAAFLGATVAHADDATLYLNCPQGWAGNAGFYNSSFNSGTAYFTWTICGFRGCGTSQTSYSNGGHQYFSSNISIGSDYDITKVYIHAPGLTISSPYGGCAG